jgi:hypothetical protein
MLKQHKYRKSIANGIIFFRGCRRRWIERPRVASGEGSGSKRYLSSHAAIGSLYTQCSDYADRYKSFIDNTFKKKEGA